MENNKKVIYYKGFDKDLKCRGFQYKEGETYVYDQEISLCNRGFHFCSNLKDVFYHYSKNGQNKFAIVEIPEDGKILISSNKCCSNKLKVVKVLKEIEIEEILEKEKRDYEDEKVYCLDLVRKLQSKYNMIIGGSVSLYLNGYNLNRDAKSIDFDIIMPYYQKMRKEDFTDLIDGIEEFDAKTSGNDYTSTFAITTKDGRFLKIDVRIDPHTKYDVITYKNFSYKTCDLMRTIEAKARYAVEGNTKHKEDILKLLKKINLIENSKSIKNESSNLFIL